MYACYNVFCETTLASFHEYMTRYCQDVIVTRVCVEMRHICSIKPSLEAVSTSTMNADPEHH